MSMSERDFIYELMYWIDWRISWEKIGMCYLSVMCIHSFLGLDLCGFRLGFTCVKTNQNELLESVDIIWYWIVEIVNQLVPIWRQYVLTQPPLISLFLKYRLHLQRRLNHMTRLGYLMHSNKLPLPNSSKSNRHIQDSSNCNITITPLIISSLKSNHNQQYL